MQIRDKRLAAEFIAWSAKFFGYEVYEEEQKREVYVTAYPGAYGIAGHVITINGSPPHGTFIFDEANAELYAWRGSTRRIGGIQEVHATTRSHVSRYEAVKHWLTRFGVKV